MRHHAVLGTLALIVIVTLAGPAAARDPETVSPGAADRLVRVADRCPTFSWVAPGDARGNEILVLALPPADDTAALPQNFDDAAEALYATVPGGASSWTPSDGDCLAAGGRYAWFVRATIAADDGQDSEATEWSQGRFFTIPAGPTPEEIERAVAILRSYLADGGDPAAVAAAMAPAGAGDRSPKTKGAPVGGEASPGTAPAAIRGEHPEPTAEAYGVVGATASPLGAGVAAMNTGGGADLLLDGAADGETDAVLTQAGIDRPSATAETFGIGNSGGGGMTLSVAGAVEADSFTGDGAGLVGITADDADTVDGQHAADLQPLTEADVETYVTNGPINLAAASSMAGVALSTGPHTVDTDTNAGTLCSPGEYLDGDGTCHTYSTGGGDADTLDGLDSTQFVRSEVDDEVDGMVTFNQPIGIGTAPTDTSMVSISRISSESEFAPAGVTVITKNLDPTTSHVYGVWTTAVSSSLGAETDSIGVRGFANGTDDSEGQRVGVQGTAEGGSGQHIGVQGQARDPEIEGERIGVRGEGSGIGMSASYGVYGVASGEGVNFGVYGEAEGGGALSWGLYTPDNAVVEGDFTVGGSTDIGTSNADILSIRSRLDTSLVPSTNASRDLGALSLGWRDLYLTGDVKNSSGQAQFIKNQTSVTQNAGFDIGQTSRFGEDLYIGDTSNSDDDSLYFDTGAEYLRWNNAQTKFEFSDDLTAESFYTDGAGYFMDVFIGHYDDALNDVLHFDFLDEYLRWNYTGELFELSDTLYASSGSTGYTYIGYGDYGLKAGGSTDAGWFDATDGTGEVWLATDHRGVYAVGTNYGGFFDDTDTTSNAKVGYSTYKIQGTGAVSFIQNHPEAADQVIVYASPEGDEVATYTRGTARLVNGEARVPLGETFRWVTNPELGLTVHLTPVGGWAQLYVVEKSTTEIVVRSAGGDPGATFDYIVHGLRIGFEEVAIVQEKEREAWIPAMTDHRELYQRRPDLERYSAGERFRTMETAAGKAAGDSGAAEALRDAIHEYDPETDGLYLPEVADRLAAAEAEAAETKE